MCACTEAAYPLLSRRTHPVGSFVKSAFNISSVDKTFGILEFLAELQRPASLQEISQAVKLPKPTAYRLLRAMQELGYVARPSESRSYLIGPRTARLAAADPYSEIKSVMSPVLRRLHGAWNETINLAVLSGTQVLYLEILETTQALRFIIPPGQSDPYFCTALGRAIAAQLPDDQLEKLYAKTRFQQLTPSTIKSLPELKKRIEFVRETGISEEIEESVPGVCCLGVSLVKLGFPEVAISIALPTQRMLDHGKANLIQALRTAAGFQD